MTKLVHAVILFAAALATVGMSTDARGTPGASLVVTVLPDRFFVDNQVTDDLNTLESEVRSSGAKAIVLTACGPGTARPQLAAAQRLSDLYLELIVAAPDSSECLAAASPRSVPVSQRIGLRPFGIDDEAVNRWLMQIGGLDGGFEAHAVADMPYGMPHVG
jgi:hypothetical protein